MTLIRNTTKLSTRQPEYGGDGRKADRCINMKLPVLAFPGHWGPDGLLFWEHADPYLYGRTTDDGRVLIGGRDEPYRDPRRRGRAIPSKIRALRVAAERRLPRIALEPAFSWAGTFAVTPDGLPYIGLHRDTPRCLFALGFGGNGIHLQRSGRGIPG